MSDCGFIHSFIYSMLLNLRSGLRGDLVFQFGGSLDFLSSATAGWNNKDDVAATASRRPIESKPTSVFVPLPPPRQLPEMIAS